MVRKLVTAGAVATMMLASAFPAFAGCQGWFCHENNNKPQVTVTNTIEMKDNVVVGVANTGLVWQNVGKVQLVKTGDAAVALTQVNQVNPYCSTCVKAPDVSSIKINGNVAVGVANTGGVVQTGGHNWFGPTTFVQGVWTGNAAVSAGQFNLVGPMDVQ